MQVLGILAFVAALLISVMIHEFGHFITAKKFGMKVTEFFVGFGKRIWSTQRGETEFGIKAIPAGGYCKISGMTPDEQMPLGEEDRAFIRAASGKKLIVLGAGSFLHFVLGAVLIFILLAGIGVNQPLPTIRDVVKGSPAATVGVQPGDEIVSINGVAVTNWGKDVAKINASGGKTIAFGIKRNGELITVTAAPERKIVNKEERFVFGIVTNYGLKTLSLPTSAKQSLFITKEFMVLTVQQLGSIPSKIPALWGQTVRGEKRDPNGLVGVVGAARVSGETLDSAKLPWRERWAMFVLMIASLNIFVGIFNLLPLLPLDGGHMAVAIADEVRGLIARARGKQRPAPIDVNSLAPITMVVFIALAALTLLLLAADIFNPVSLNL